MQLKTARCHHSEPYQRRNMAGIAAHQGTVEASYYIPDCSETSRACYMPNENCSSCGLCHIKGHQCKERPIVFWKSDTRFINWVNMKNIGCRFRRTGQYQVKGLHIVFLQSMLSSDPQPRRQSPSLIYCGTLHQTWLQEFLKTLRHLWL